MAHLKVAGAIFKPKLMPLNSKRPELVMKAVFDLSHGTTGMCQYLLRRSRVEKYLQRLGLGVNYYS